MIESLDLPPDRSGEAFAVDKDYIDSALAEAQRLVDKCGLTEGQSVLDLGCGYGKLAMGIVLTGLDVYYAGLDVRQAAVHWCAEHFEPFGADDFHFEHLDVHNERYNTQGKPIDPVSFGFPFGDSHFDVVYAFSVFSHMRPQTAHVYLSEIARVLKPEGVAFLTAFVRPKGIKFAVNPTDFGTSLTDDTPLHFCVYKQQYLESLFARAGLVKAKRRAKLPESTQSVYYLRRA